LCSTASFDSSFLKIASIIRPWFDQAIDDSLLETMDLAALPVEWTVEPPSPSTMGIGDLGGKESRSAVLELPSVMVPPELHRQLDLTHANFKKIIVGLVR
jgi:hypothetical protein